MKKTLLITVIISSIVLIGCKKYSDGGLVSKSEKRLTAHSWKLEKYFRAGNDETNLLLANGFSENFSENGTISISYTDSEGDSYNETGDWAFYNDNTKIKFTGIGSIQLNDETSIISSSDYNIIRLKKDELWYYYENGGTKHEFHMIR